ncbi:MAG: Flp pilus assembly protein CpaB [Sporomusaceae bacterium]|nr:Flp pilus assembly protein CpaB [Sporomusaceae bacterium]
MTSGQLIFLALAASSLLAGLLYFYLSGLESRQALRQQTQQNLLPLVVAAADIPEKAVIQAPMLKTVLVPAELVAADSVSAVSALTGKVAKLKILQGDPVTAQKVADDARLAGFIGKIPADKRAISIPVSDVTGISGFARPGDSVDVLLVSDKARKNAITATTVLQNVLLLAINKNDAADGKSESPATATLAVVPADALRLAALPAQGTIYLALRPLKPQPAAAAAEFVAPRFGGDEAARPAAAAPAPVQAPSPAAGSIPVIRGNSVNLVEVR